jgi:hypothetical protein
MDYKFAQIAEDYNTKAWVKGQRYSHLQSGCYRKRKVDEPDYSPFTSSNWRKKAGACSATSAWGYRSLAVDR